MCSQRCMHMQSPPRHRWTSGAHRTPNLDFCNEVQARQDPGQDPHVHFGASPRLRMGAWHTVVARTCPDAASGRVVTTKRTQGGRRASVADTSCSALLPHTTGQVVRESDLPPTCNVCGWLVGWLACWVSVTVNGWVRATTQ